MSESSIVGVIEPNCLYTLREFQKRIGVAASTLRAARRAGLKVHYVHRQAYVYGRDWVDYVLASNRTSPQDAASPSPADMRSAG